jgi:nanoRNase/pAp phosphatase (c-di-AMP/oligoRNAs hydrolase)
MDSALLQKIREILAKNDNIGIAVGKNPSIDQMAAALSLYLLLKQARKKVSIASPTQPIVELTNLVGIDKVQPKLESQEGDLVVSFPYVEGEIEKVSYTLENGSLNIIVKATKQGLTFDEKDVKYTKGGGGALSTLFTIGAPSLSDVESLMQQDKMANTKIINIDNKSENQKFGDIILVSTDYSSLSEQISDLVLSLGFRPDKDVAQNLLSGITYATRNFQDPATGPLAFEIASMLMRNGARRVSLNSHAPRMQEAPIQQRRTPQQRLNQKEDNFKKSEDQNTPNDWLEPKVYKGSSNF